MLFKYLLKKMFDKFEDTKNYAKEIGYYDDENSIFLQDKINVLKDFIEEYELKENIISNEKDIIVLDSNQYNSYVFITNNDYLTLGLPSTNYNSCMSVRGVYNLSLIFEKILFGNHFLNIFTINKNMINKNKILSLINNNYYKLIFKFYFTSFDYKYNNNKRITLFYVPEKISYIFEYYLINSNAEDDISYFIRNFLCYNENKIKNYFIPIEKVSKFKVNVYDLINNSIEEQDKFKFYTHKIKVGALISGKNFEKFENFIKNANLNYELNEHKIKFIGLNNTENPNFIAKQILINYPELKKYFLAKYDKIEKIINFIYGNQNVCSICYLNSNKKGHLFCEEIYEILESWYLGIDERKEDEIWHKITYYKDNCENDYEYYYEDDYYEEDEEEIL